MCMTLDMGEIQLDIELGVTGILQCATVGTAGGMPSKAQDRPLSLTRERVEHALAPPTSLRLTDADCQLEMLPSINTSHLLLRS